ncbi:MAG: DnaJ domain-containing protein [Spiroplasma ixodetis]|uniref:DnaJ domain-containing protein n=1 Tax=Spiroplasma endosymbiont of Lariophagus distinguendus TaxID=2935082 RepID=UPI0020793362|nr:DnaJ domain-containing protein [Spiroplasma endosymbiont of Lariophagus distinguendus]MBP1524984.1 DnaJ domain-containing protein [Spiroplasma ixodetis]MBP1527689.1 DnaJ domain-containing protein [Spiroplasma ixodetis]
MKDESLISNYYDILNVLPTASVAEIKKKFKQTALKTHPDKNNNPQSKLKMQELNEAKRILTDENLRKVFDQKLFIYFLQNGNNKVVIYFLTNKINNLNINEKDNSGNTPLHYACFHNFLETADLLIKYGANINAKNNSDNTPLHYAIMGNADLKFINLLINKGANFIEKDKMGNDSLSFAKDFSKDKKVSKFFLKKMQKLRIKQNQQILLNITKRITNIEREIINIERDIAHFEQKKTNSVLNYIIIIFTFGCVNKNKDINKDILIKTDQLKNLLLEKEIANNEKHVFEEKIKRLSFNKTKKINAMDLQNQPSTSGYNPSNSSCI